jgi:hypothetical protein
MNAVYAGPHSIAARIEGIREKENARFREASDPAFDPATLLPSDPA